MPENLRHFPGGVKGGAPARDGGNSGPADCKRIVTLSTLKDASEEKKRQLFFLLFFLDERAKLGGNARPTNGMKVHTNGIPSRTKFVKFANMSELDSDIRRPPFAHTDVRCLE